MKLFCFVIKVFALQICPKHANKKKIKYANYWSYTCGISYTCIKAIIRCAIRKKSNLSALFLKHTICIMYITCNCASCQDKTRYLQHSTQKSFTTVSYYKYSSLSLISDNTVRSKKKLSTSTGEVKTSVLSQILIFSRIQVLIRCKQIF